MRTSVKLSVKCSDANVCRQLVSVLTPDNIDTPQGMTLKINTMKDALEFRIASDSSSEAISTALAVLRDVILFEEVWLLSRFKRT